MDDEGQNMDKNRDKKTRVLHGADNIDNDNDASEDENSELRVNLRELLNVSTDWKDTNSKMGGENQLGGGGGHLNLEFQAKQIERIVEAIAMTIPQGAASSSMFGGGHGLGM